jgi:cytochrome c556
MEFKTFSQNKHFWSDVDTRLIELTALAVALRPTTALLGRHHHGVSIATAQRRIAHVGDLCTKEMSRSVTFCPPVIVLDGLWITKMMPTGRFKKDKKGRQRREKRGQKIPVLFASGIDPVTGEKQVLAWVQGSQEDAGSWQKLLDILQKRGVSYEHGLRLFIHDGSAGLELAFEIVDFPSVKRQRCVFHKLRNVLRAIVGRPKMSREEKKGLVKTILQEAAAIYQAADAPEARQRLAAFAEKWRQAEADAVATLERDFEATLACYAVQEEALQETGQIWPMKYLRTTSALERQNETCRAKFRQARAFWSTDGLDAAVYLRTHAYPALKDGFSDTQLARLAISIWQT